MRRSGTGLTALESTFGVGWGLSSCFLFFWFVEYSDWVIATLSTSVFFSKITLSKVLALDTVVKAASPRDLVDGDAFVAASFLLLVAVGMMKQYNGCKSNDEWMRL